MRLQRTTLLLRVLIFLSAYYTISKSKSSKTPTSTPSAPSINKALALVSTKYLFGVTTAVPSVCSETVITRSASYIINSFFITTILNTVNLARIRPPSPCLNCGIALSFWCFQFQSPTIQELY